MSETGAPARERGMNLNLPAEALRAELERVWAEHDDLVRRGVRSSDELPHELDESDVYYLNCDLLGATRETVTGDTQAQAILLAARVLASAGIRELK